MYLWIWIVAIMAGALGQFLDALAGMGFGAISGTVLLAGGVAPAMAVSVVNLAKVGSGLVSGIAHWRAGNIRWAWVLPLALPGVMGGVLAALVLSRLPESTSRLVVPLLLLVMGVLLLRRFLLSNGTLPRIAGASQEVAVPRDAWDALRRRLNVSPGSAWLVGIGFLAGLVNGISGAFGPVATSAVILNKGGHPRYAIGTVNLVEFFVAAATATTLLVQLGLSSLQWQLPLALVVGGLLTAPLGAYLSRRLSAKVVGTIVGVLLISLNLWGVLRELV